MNLKVPRCRVCHRQLKSPSAISDGIGKQCKRSITGGHRTRKVRMGPIEAHPDQLELVFDGKALPAGAGSQ